MFSCDIQQCVLLSSVLQLCQSQVVPGMGKWAEDTVEHTKSNTPFTLETHISLSSESSSTEGGPLPREGEATLPSPLSISRF